MVSIGAIIPPECARRLERRDPAHPPGAIRVPPRSNSASGELTTVWETLNGVADGIACKESVARPILRCWRRPSAASKRSCDSRDRPAAPGAQDPRSGPAGNETKRDTFSAVSRTNFGVNPLPTSQRLHRTEWPKVAQIARALLRFLAILWLTVADSAPAPFYITRNCRRPLGSTERVPVMC